MYSRKHIVIGANASKALIAMFANWVDKNPNHPAMPTIK